LVLEHGSETRQRFPTFDEATLRATIDQAASSDLLVVTHVSNLDTAIIAIRNGSDGLAHIFIDTAADSSFVDLMIDHAAFVIPTLVVLSSFTNAPSGQSIIDDPEFVSLLTLFEVNNLARTFPGDRYELNVAIDSVTMLHAAGVPILAGSDAPNPGTAFGASLHRELEYFTQAGMSAIEALASATSLPAEIFGLTDRGRIKPGLLADLVLVNGDPTTDITATRSIAAVSKDGIPIPIR
jgi:imidazolonepropionase-like amidohydrolase